MVVAEERWDETEHELGRLTASQVWELQRAVTSLVVDRALEVIPQAVYAHHEATARRRVPRDARDWPPVALALTLDAAILTGDHDFLGCGCPTWTVDTLRAHLDEP